MSIPTHKIVLVGNSQVGKTSWVHRLLDNSFKTSYTPTVGVEVHPIVLQCNKKNVCFNVWDISGEEKYGGLAQGYLVASEGAIIMIDSNDRNHGKTIAKWMAFLPKNIPIVVVENVTEGSLNLGYCSINVKEGTSIGNPLTLMGSLLRH